MRSARDDVVAGTPLEGIDSGGLVIQIEHELVSRVQSMARLRHIEYQRRADDTPRADPMAIARVAMTLGRVYYESRHIGESSTKKLVLLCAGNLVYAMDCYGLSFEMVVDLSEERIARVVSGLSPDISLPHGLRKQAVRSKLIAASIDSQIVRLAELYCVARLIKETYAPEDFKLHTTALVRWAEDAEELLEGLVKLKKSQVPEIYAVLDQTREMILHVAKTAKPSRKRTIRNNGVPVGQVESPTPVVDAPTAQDPREPSCSPSPNPPRC